MERGELADTHQSTALAHRQDLPYPGTSLQPKGWVATTDVDGEDDADSGREDMVGEGKKETDDGTRRTRRYMECRD